jgi:hypothetical protein
VEKETHFITNILKQTNIQIAFRTKNTFQNLLRPKNPTTDKFSSSGVYELTCPECNKAYVGQTGRRFSSCYNEYKRAFYNSNPASSSFAQHLEKAHPFGPIHNVMQILHYHKKSPHLNIMEKFHIYSEYLNNSHLNDEHTIFPNKIFDSILKT